MATEKFSDRLEKWLRSTKPKTLGDLQTVFEDKAFALAFLLLLFIPALPLPTGGISHVTEIIAMLLALEMIAGRRAIWLPKRWAKRDLGKTTQKKALPFIMRRIRWFEKYSRPRLSGMLDQTAVRSFVGLTVFLLTLAAFLSPPFSGLDTLPSLGVVIIALGLILEDAALYIVGAVIGIIGIVVTIGLGTAFIHLLHHL
jgi:hypothetical protein